LDLPLSQAGSSPLIDMQVAVQRGDLAAVRQYLPAPIMSQKAVAWLDRSLVSGEIRGGSFVLQGPLDQVPFDNGGGQLVASLPVSNAILDYHQAWTRIEQLDAEIAFNGRSMDIHGKKGKIRSASLGEVHARIKDLTAPDLELDGSVYGSLPVMLAELASSPLGNTYGGFVDRTSSSGDVALQLDIDIPLRGKRPVDVRGEILLKGNTLVVKEAEVSLDNIKGKLAFDTRGIKGRSLEASLFEKPVAVEVWTDSADAVTNVSLRGPLALVDLARKNNMQLAPFLSGRSEWEVLLGIGQLQRRSDKPGIALKISSTLEGVGIELPEPFGKPPAETRPFAISVENMGDPDRVVRFRYADIANGVFGMKQAAQGLEWDRGNVAIGAERAVLPDGDILSITGRLQRLALSRWQPVFARWQSGTGPPLKTDVLIDELQYAGHRLQGVEVQAVKTGLVQDITLGGPGVEGKLQLAYEGGGIEQVLMNLDHLVVEKDTGISAGNDLSLSPAAFPNLRVTVQEFTYAGVDLGEVDLLAIQEAGKIHVDRLVLASDFLDLRMMGDWEQVDGQSISRFNITYSDGMLETLLEAFDYKENVSGGSLSGSLRASWQGDPWDFLPERVNGKLYLLIKDGQLLDVEPGAGRVLGLLSLHTLSRRLLLDFSDLFKKGFTFDRIEGNFTLTGGDAQTSDLTIEGPAARIEIAGRVGLAAKDYDELVTVIPRVGSSLPLAGAIAGGPVVGAALLVADKLLGKEIEGMTSFAHTSYSVTGPWSDPVYTRLASPAIETVTTEPEDIE
ncbi:MAG: TIGR02099 family protein, partial [Halobacteria archaeon]|nr:TIGR02099 family protein [Halobacteria archaeon]